MQNEEKTEKEENFQSTDEAREADNKSENGQSPDEQSSDVKDIASLEAKNAELNDKYLRLYSEYDNYRKRTVREKAEIIKTAGEDVLKAILPVIDDFERALKANEGQNDAEPIKEGMQLIYNKLKKAVQQKGLQSFDSIGETFNPDTMEAITHIPAADDASRGKVVDEVEKGYRIGDKVIRFAKVVVGQ